MEGLTKPNFFNEMSDKYPLGTEMFKKWIDEQKKHLDWPELFNKIGINRPGIVNGKVTDWEIAKQFITGFIEKYPHVDAFSVRFTDTPKFHDMPFEIQYGLLIKFIGTCRKVNYNIGFDVFAMRTALKTILKELDYKIQSGKLDRL